MSIHVVVTGPIGIGKSTVVRRAMRLLEITLPRGFFTRSTREGSRPLFHTLETWAGIHEVFAARTTDLKFAARTTDPKQRWPYDVDPGVFDGLGVAALKADSPSHWTVMDELGVMEQGALEFVSEVRRTFLRPEPILAVVQQRALEFWLSEIGRDHVDFIVSVDAANRDRLPEMLADRCRTVNSFRSGQGSVQSI